MTPHAPIDHRLWCPEPHPALSRFESKLQGSLMVDPIDKSTSSPLFTIKESLARALA